MDFGLQLYSVRDAAGQDFAGTVKKVAQIGYRKVETAGFYGLSAETVRGYLDDAGLTVCSNHSGLDDLDRDFAGMVKYLRTIGSQNYVIPFMDWSTQEAFRNNLAQINKYQPMLEAEGFTVHYHNHSHEFIALDGVTGIEALFNNTAIHFEIDTYWAFNAGHDPIEVLKKYRDRIRMIHVKDGVPDVEGRALGAGKAPVKAVCEAAADMGIYRIVESENQKPDGITEVTACFDYLKSIQ